MNVGFLEGLRVLELGDGVAGASAAGLLAGLGAEVTSVIDAGSAHRRGRPRSPAAATAAARYSEPVWTEARNSGLAITPSCSTCSGCRSTS